MAKVTITYEIKGYDEEALKSLFLDLVSYDCSNISPIQFGLEVGEGTEVKNVTVESESFSYGLKEIKDYWNKIRGDGTTFPNSEEFLKSLLPEDIYAYISQEEKD